MSTNKKIKVRELTELRQGTAKMQSNALQNRIKHYQDRESNPLMGNLKNIVADAADLLIKTIQEVDKLIPEKPKEQFLDVYKKLLLLF